MMVLLCATVALQPSNHAHAQPATAGDHHNHAGPDHPGKGHDAHHPPAHSPETCCHVAISGCSAAAFLPTALAGSAALRPLGATPWVAAPDSMAGRVTPPEDRPPRSSV